MRTAETFENMLSSGADKWMQAARSWAEMYKNAWEKVMHSGMNLAEQWNAAAAAGVAHHEDNCCRPTGVCPPDPYCPPRCLAEIKRTACPGEVIVVPFSLKNTCGNTRTYRLGIRPMVNRQGQPAPVQPWLDRAELHLEPGQIATLTLTVNLTDGFQPGDCYQADIVIRENKVNQNVCFELCVEACKPAVEVHPLDEKRYLMRWQHWQDHYYCEQAPDTGRRAGQNT